MRYMTRRSRSSMKAGFAMRRRNRPGSERLVGRTRVLLGRLILARLLSADRFAPGLITPILFTPWLLATTLIVARSVAPRFIPRTLALAKTSATLHVPKHAAKRVNLTLIRGFLNLGKLERFQNLLHFLQHFVQGSD